MGLHFHYERNSQGETAMTKFGLAQPVRRVEDPRLLKGVGKYTDDYSLPGEAHGVVLRSPHAAAKILSVDTSGADGMPGVLAVVTGKELKEAGLGDRPCMIPLKNRDGSPRADTPYPVLQTSMVRHVGDPVAFVVAETHQQARDAAEAVMVEYDVLPSITDLGAAMDDGAPQVWDGVKNNLCFDWEAGDKAAADAAFAEAAPTASSSPAWRPAPPSPPSTSPAGAGRSPPTPRAAGP